MNWYVYCNNDPINYHDPLGLERIVVSGGIYNATSYSVWEFWKWGERRWPFTFISPALKYMKDNKKNFNTWIIADNGWTAEDKKMIEAARKTHIPKVKIKYIKSSDELAKYINKKATGSGSYKGLSKARKDDPIKHFAVFSHGYEGSLELGHDYKNDSSGLSFGKSKISSLKKKAFAKKSKSVFYSCNTGTGGADSFAQVWANKFGKTIAYTGKTDYAGILNGGFDANEIPLADNLPVAGSNSKRKKFK